MDRRGRQDALLGSAAAQRDQKSETIKGAKPQASPAAPAAPPGAPPGVAGQPGAAPAKSPNDQEMEFRKRRLQQAELEAKAQKDAQAAEEKKRNCQRATEQVTPFERGGRMTRYGPNGEQLYHEDREIADGADQREKGRRLLVQVNAIRPVRRRALPV